MNPFRRKNDLVNQAVVLDTSGIIDGRIIQIAQAGFVPQQVVVPQFVIAELQFLADHGDTHKRERARYGLDVIRELQDIRRIEVSIARQKFEHIKEVDDKLVALAKQYNAYLYTTDFNLNKVAQIEGVAVLNVNELAQALRPNLLPGERVTIKLTQVGQDKTQGVGYLNDGTMVVVEQASRFVGQQVQATCTRILQTQAGKMMFATLASATAMPKPQSQQKPQENQNRPKKQVAQQKETHQPRPEQQEQRHPQPAVSRPKQQRAQQPKQQSSGNKATQQNQANNKPRHNQNNNKNQQQSQRASKPQAPRPNQNRRRKLSPEDSLIATIKEIEQ